MVEKVEGSELIADATVLTTENVKKPIDIILEAIEKDPEHFLDHILTLSF